MAEIIDYKTEKERICKRREAEIEAEIKEQYGRENLIHGIMFILQVVLIVAAFLVVGS